VKRIAKWIGIALVLLLVAVAAAPFLVDVNRFRPALESKLTAALQREVRLGELGLSLFSGSVSAAGLSVADDPAFGKEPFVRAKSLRIGVQLWPLIRSRKLNITGLTVDRPEVHIIQSEAGEWNFSTLGGRRAATQRPAEVAGADKGLDLWVSELKLASGRVTLTKKRRHSRPLVLDDVHAEVREFSADSAFPFSLSAKVTGGGALDVKGKAGPVRDDVSRSPLEAGIKAAHLDLAASDWFQAVPGMAGIAGLEGTIVSDGAVARVKGRLDLAKLKMGRTGTPAPRDVQLDFEIQHRLESRSGTLSRGNIRIGKAAASLTGAYARQGTGTSLKMALDGPSMPVGDLAAMLPAFGVTLPAGSSLQGGTASVKLAAEGPADRLVTQGSLGLNDTKLAGFDLGRKMSVIAALAGIKAGPDTEIKTLSANVRASAEGLEAHDLQFLVPAIGELRGGGTVSPSNALAFRMTAKVHTSGMAAALSKETIPFTIAGTASDPVFRPDVKAVLSEKAKTFGQQGAQRLLKGLFGQREK